MNPLLRRTLFSSTFFKCTYKYRISPITNSSLRTFFKSSILLKPHHTYNHANFQSSTSFFGRTRSIIRVLLRKFHGNHNIKESFNIDAASGSVSTRYILKAMFDFIWPKTGKQVKIRVLIALSLLLLSK
ncbi:unnamed protein product, partial [Rotaria sp. Silwood1]